MDGKMWKIEEGKISGMGNVTNKRMDHNKK